MLPCFDHLTALKFFQHLVAWLFSPDNAVIIAKGFFRCRFCLLWTCHVKMTLGNYCLWRAESPKLKKTWAISFFPRLLFFPCVSCSLFSINFKRDLLLSLLWLCQWESTTISWVTLKSNAWHGLLEMHLPLSSLFCHQAVFSFSEKLILLLFLCMKGVPK